ncbi:Probable pectinesterase/pectinesterase inhibitor 36 [Linum perenne]
MKTAAARRCTSVMSPFIITLFSFFFLAPAASSATFPESSEAVRIVRTQVAIARSLVEQSLNSTPNDTSVVISRGALSDCVKLYKETEWMLEPLANVHDHDHDDAVTWLSAALSNHMSCIDGLSLTSHIAVNNRQNLTTSIRNSLALYAHRKSAAANNSGGSSSNEGVVLLTSWTSANSKANFVVAKDGSGTHCSINNAVEAAAAASGGRTRVVIYVKAGVYNEKVEIPRQLKNLMLVGDGIDRTVVTGSRNVPDGSTTYNSATFGVSGDGFWARDITFENTAGPQKHQAVALRVNSDRAVFYRCSFRGYQDTLFVHSLRQFYRDCHIYGTIDFIFGDASAVLQNCDIFVRKPLRSQANFITAQGREDPNQNTGISIQGSRVRPASDFAGSSSSIRSYLGRPWKEYSRTVVWESDLDGVIDPKGWNEWRGGFALSTLYYAEYRNLGSGAGTKGRVRWPGFHLLTRPEQVRDFSVSRFIQGDTWIPASGVPFRLGV